ncbi:MAG TPA: phosphatase PAP2 family protein [Pyrinomonadaceae bacterium]|jgi:membrane-associated phospholipid phosphatase|nr:phosphatase PAP2 family protein [Pyrinomonadaceae bacterium]
MLCAFILLASTGATAQSSAGGASPGAQSPSSPQAKPTPSLERSFFKNILRDQRAIWTSPFHMERGDAKWLAPLGLSAAALFATDRRTAGELSADNQNRLRISRDISQGGAVYTTGGIAATFYLVGRATKNARARETGLLGVEALIDGGIVSTALKAISQRPRPTVDDASGEFFDGGNSFPSGHAISAWSLATVVAYEYGQHRPFVRFGAYGLATAVSLSRYTGRNHFLSDVLVGSAIGYGIGRYVYRAHHDTSLDSIEGEIKHRENHSKLIPFTSPIFSRASQAYGLALAWNF